MSEAGLGLGWGSSSPVPPSATVDRIPFPTSICPHRQELQDLLSLSVLSHSARALQLLTPILTSGIPPSNIVSLQKWGKCGQGGELGMGKKLTMSGDRIRILSLPAAMPSQLPVLDRPAQLPAGKNKSGSYGSPEKQESFRTSRAERRKRGAGAGAEHQVKMFEPGTEQDASDLPRRGCLSSREEEAEAIWAIRTCVLPQKPYRLQWHGKATCSRELTRECCLTSTAWVWKTDPQGLLPCSATLHSHSQIIYPALQG